MSRLSDLDLLREIIPQVEKTTTPKSKKDECRTRSVKSTELIQKEEDSKQESENTKELRERVAKLKETEEFDKIKTGASLGLTAYQKPKLGIPIKDLSSDLQSFIRLTEATLKQSKHFGKVAYDRLTSRINFYAYDDVNLENVLGFIDTTNLSSKLYIDKILDITSDNAIANSSVAEAIQNIKTLIPNIFIQEETLTIHKL